MKHLVPLLLACIGLMLTPRAAYAHDSTDAPVKPDAQPSPTPTKFDAQPSSTPAKSDAQPSSTPNSVVGYPDPPNSETSAGAGGIEAGYAYGFASVHDFHLVAEFPVVFIPNRDVKSGNPSLARSYSSLFFTPALRIVYARDRVKHPGYPPLYPWISVGGGLAHFSPSAINLAGGASAAKGSTESAGQFGAGMDVGIYRRAIALRAEVRDFYTAPPNLGVAGINLRHNNVVASAGIVFWFCKHCWDKPSLDQKSPTASPAHK